MTNNQPINPSLIERNVTYHEDASALFRALGGVGSEGAALLESADISTRSGISSLAVLHSSLRLTCRGERVEITPLSPSGEILGERLGEELSAYRDGAGEGAFRFPPSAAAEEGERLTAVSTVEPLRRIVESPGYPEGLPLLVGGFAFDYLGTFEDLPAVGDSPNTYPDYQFHLAEVLLDINHRERTATLRAIAAPGREEEVRRRVESLAESIAQFHVKHRPPPGEPDGALRVQAEPTDADFRAQVGEMKRHIERGDVYQVVPSRTFTAPCTDAFAAYLHLRATNPSPYMFYVQGVSDDGRPFELFGASPESNLKYEASDRTLQLYPIAGTRPRGLRRTVPSITSWTSGTSWPCARTPRSSRSTPCSWTSPATTSPAWRRSERGGWPICSRWTATPASCTSSPASPPASRPGSTPWTPTAPA